MKAAEINDGPSVPPVPPTVSTAGIDVGANTKNTEKTVKDKVTLAIGCAPPFSKQRILEPGDGNVYPKDRDYMVREGRGQMHKLAQKLGGNKKLMELYLTRSYTFHPSIVANTLWKNGFTIVMNPESFYGFEVSEEPPAKEGSGTILGDRMVAEEPAKADAVINDKTKKSLDRDIHAWQVEAARLNLLQELPDLPPFLDALVFELGPSSRDRVFSRAEFSGNQDAFDLVLNELGYRYGRKGVLNTMWQAGFDIDVQGMGFIVRGKKPNPDGHGNVTGRNDKQTIETILKARIEKNDINGYYDHFQYQEKR